MSTETISAFPETCDSDLIPQPYSQLLVDSSTVIPDADQALGFLVNVATDRNALKLALDRSRARVAQLRLAVDRAVLLIVASDSFNLDTIENAELLKEYFQSMGYPDSLDIDKSNPQEALVDLIIKPVMETDESDELQILHDAMAYRELNRAG